MVGSEYGNDAHFRSQGDRLAEAGNQYRPSRVANTQQTINQTFHYNGRVMNDPSLNRDQQAMWDKVNRKQANRAKYKTNSQGYSLR